MKYQEVLYKFKEFMYDTGIERYCSEKCFGYCCCSCENGYKSNDCQNRLACKAFLCNEMRRYLFDENAYGKWYSMMGYIRHKIEGENLLNPYFHKFMLYMNEIEFDDNEISFLSMIDRHKIKIQIETLSALLYQHDIGLKRQSIMR